MNRLLKTLHILVTAALVACSGSDAPPVATGPLQVDTAVLAQIPTPLTPDAEQARGTFVGAVGPNAAAYIGFVVQGDYALVYLCDGIDGEWFGAQIKQGEIRVTSAAGTAFAATVTGDRIEGTVTAPAWSTRAFRAEPPSAGNGIFVGADPTLPDYTRRWLVLPEGVRGVSKIKTTSTLANVGPVNGVSTGPGALTVKAPTVTAKIVETVVKPPSTPATPNSNAPLPALAPVTDAEMKGSGVSWSTFGPGQCFGISASRSATCLGASDWPPQCRSLSADRIVCPDTPYLTATLAPVTPAEITASGVPWSTFRPGECYGVRASQSATCQGASDWPPQCRSLSVDRIVCPDALYITATLAPVTEAEIKDSGVSWSTFGPGQCFGISASRSATCLGASDWPPQCRSLSVDRIVCPDTPYITATLPPVTPAEITASGVSWSTFGPGQCFGISASRSAICQSASDWPPQCRSLSASQIACPDAPYATAALQPISQAEINASGVTWTTFRPGECYGLRTGRQAVSCLNASDWPPQCRSLSADRIVCPEPGDLTAALPPITKAEIDASGVPWINFGAGDCYELQTGRNRSCLNAADWPPQCRSLSADRIVCPDPLFGRPTPPALAGGPKFDCDTLARLLLSITNTANLKDAVVQKEIAALQAQQKLNGCTK